MTKGYITVATGKDIYYELAANLVKSYKLMCGSSYRFAILCDRENEYTKEFDDVIILDNVKNNYLDKFRMLTDCPYDENIFIESDCLIYNNIDIFWNMFEGATDFSTFGWNSGDLKVWFGNPEISKIIGSDNIPIFCPGYFYIRKNDFCRSIYNDSMEIIDYLYEHKEENPKCFLANGTLRDDPVFMAVMAKNKCLCAVKPKVAKCLQLPSEKRRIVARISRGLLKYGGGKKGGNILHFSSARTKEGMYAHQVFVLNAIINKKSYAKIADCFIAYAFFILRSVIKNKSLREFSRPVKKILKEIKARFGK